MDESSNDETIFKVVLWGKGLPPKVFTPRRAQYFSTAGTAEGELQERKRTIDQEYTRCIGWQEKGGQVVGPLVAADLSVREQVSREQQPNRALAKLNSSPPYSVTAAGPRPVFEPLPDKLSEEFDLDLFTFNNDGSVVDQGLFLPRVTEHLGLGQDATLGDGSRGFEPPAGGANLDGLGGSVTHAPIL